MRRPLWPSMKQISEVETTTSSRPAFSGVVAASVMACRAPLLAGGWVEGLAQDRHLSAGDELAGLRSQRLPGDEDDSRPHARADLIERRKEALAVQIGHPHVAHDEVIGCGSQLLERQAAVQRRVHLVPFAGEEI